MAVLSYLGILVLIPLLSSPRSPYVRFHANQGIILLIAEVIYGVTIGVLSTIIGLISWRLYFIITILGCCAFIFLVFSIIGMINAASGQKKELPLLGSIRMIK